MTEDREQAYAVSKLRRAWRDVRRRSTAAGPDGRDVDAFASIADCEIPAVSSRLRAGRYRFGPVRRLSIPKGDGGLRPIGIPNVADRIALRALCSAMMRVLHPRMHRSSFAYRPGRSVCQAVEVVRAGARLGWAARLDVRDCFDSLDWELMDDALLELGASEWMLSDLHAARSAGTVGRTGFELRTVGLAQGSAVAPVVCNAMLDRLDRTLSSKGFEAVRYADDLVVMAENARRCELAVDVARHTLAELRMTLNEDKTWIGSYLTGFRFLGTEFVGSYAFPALEAVRSDGRVVRVSGYEGESPELRGGWHVPYGVSWV